MTGRGRAACRLAPSSISERPFEPGVRGYTAHPILLP
jgi:hypothetical protein